MSSDKLVYTEKEYDTLARECDRLEGELNKQGELQRITARMQALRCAVRVTTVANRVTSIAKMFENYIMTGEFTDQEIKDPSNETE